MRDVLFFLAKVIVDFIWAYILVVFGLKGLAKHLFGVFLTPEMLFFLWLFFSIVFVTLRFKYDL
ncbi:MAG: hypothetical protein DRG83_00280 [Deltaproteobacteria bacterium]|nr:MAG: hypothetical protein DRG83_00280 [Deltaproteobacteria bacterium]